MLSNTSNIVWNKDALSIEDLNISIGGKSLIIKSLQQNKI